MSVEGRGPGLSGARAITEGGSPRRGRLGNGAYTAVGSSGVAGAGRQEQGRRLCAASPVPDLPVSPSDRVFFAAYRRALPLVVRVTGVVGISLGLEHRALRADNDFHLLAVAARELDRVYDRAVFIVDRHALYA